jgi:hypothetical protein
MSELSTTVGSGFAEYFDKIREKLHKWVDPLSEEQFWKNPFPYGNDVGHLVLHLTGNLNYYIGAQIAANGYVRDRNREFTETARRSKSQVLQSFDHAGRRYRPQTVSRRLEPGIFRRTQHVEEPLRHCAGLRGPRRSSRRSNHQSEPRVVT